MIFKFDSLQIRKTFNVTNLRIYPHPQPCRGLNFKCSGCTIVFVLNKVKEGERGGRGCFFRPKNQRKSINKIS